MAAPLSHGGGEHQSQEDAEDPAGLVYQAGSALRPGAFYVRRAADDELAAALRRGAFTYVLAPRQIGKSSLRVRVAAALRQDGLRCAEVEVAHIVDGGATCFYRTLCSLLAAELSMACDVDAFFAAQGGIAEPEVLLRFLRQQMLAQVPGTVVLFLDEIDALLAPGFPRDDFFAAVRQAGSERARAPEWARLTFCLLGVATPAELMSDPARTPFNNATGVWLLDFTEEEAQALAPGLDGLPGGGARWLAEVLRWTGGNPYMTQKLCGELARFPEEAVGQEPTALVLRLVAEHFLERDDSNLVYAEVRLRERPVPGGRAAALALYRRLLAGEEPLLSEGSGVQMALRLSGLAALRRGPEGRLLLALRNRVFEKVYDAAWVAAQEGGNLLLEATRRWEAAERNAALVLRGPALEEAKAWARGPGKERVSGAAWEFLEACQGVAGQAALAERAAAEVGRLRRLVVALVVLLVLAMGAAWVALWMRTEAKQQEAQAQRHAERAKQAEREQRGHLASLRSQQSGGETAALVDSVLAAREDWRRAPLTPPVVAGLAQANAAQHRSLPLEGHEGIVWGAVFSPDGGRVLTGSEDNTARLWDARMGKELLRLSGHTAGVVSAVFSPDGGQVLTSSGDKTARLWDARTGKELLRLSGHTARVMSAVFSPDGERVLTGSEDKTARLWDARTGMELLRFLGHTARVKSGVFSPDGKRVLTGSEDKTARLWDARTGKELLRLSGHTNWVMSAVFSSDGTQVLTGSGDKTARLWDARTGTELLRFSGHMHWVESAVFSPDGARVLTAGVDGTARLWDARTGKELLRLNGHYSWVESAVFSRDGGRVLTGSWDNTARLWDAHTGQELLRLAENRALGENGTSGAILGAGGESLVAFSPDGTRLVAAVGRQAVVADITDAAFLSRACYYLRARNPPPLSDPFRDDFARAQRICATVPSTVPL